MTDAVEHALQFKQILDFEYAISYYGTTLGGDIYFSKRLRQIAWSSASDQQKIAALFEATEMINRLNFRGDKYSATQKLEFPRNTDTEVPEDIEKATYELAYMLLDGLDPEKEARQAKVASKQIGPLSTSYQNRNDSPTVTAGIFSSKAWSLLAPYLRDPTSVSLMRVN